MLIGAVVGQDQRSTCSRISLSVALGHPRKIRNCFWLSEPRTMYCSSRGCFAAELTDRKCPMICQFLCKAWRRHDMTAMNKLGSKPAYDDAMLLRAIEAVENVPGKPAICQRTNHAGTTTHNRIGQILGNATLLSETHQPPSRAPASRLPAGSRAQTKARRCPRPRGDCYPHLGMRLAWLRTCADSSPSAP